MQQALDAFSGLLTFNPTAEEYQMGREAVAALRDRLAQPEQKPVAHTTGHCENHKQKGGCQLHNLQCGWPDCDRKPITAPQPEQKPVAWQVMVEDEAMKEFPIKDMAHDWCVKQKLSGSPYSYWIRPLYTTPPAAQRTWVGLTERELELIDGMIAVQLYHAARCDSIANRTMAEKQKGWDMERVALLQKLKENK
jgi:hypothetical protein